MDDIVFLFDVDDALLDNNRIREELSVHLATCHSADYLGALGCHRSEDVHDPQIFKMVSWLADDQIADRLVLSDGDGVSIERLYPAAHYVLIDDRLRILAAVKAKWADRVTTVFPGQGHYANDPQALAAYPAADVQVERIGDLAAFERARFGPNKDQGVRR